jgi:fructose-bisphosphate aldolase/6-deoxy-5-ketofructose 1-phosphate synthase
MAKSSDSLNVNTPLDVPQSQANMFEENYKSITTPNGKLFIFVGDQKIEHLNDDFCGNDIPTQNSEPENLFKIASKSKIGGFAVHPGLLCRYARNYPDIPYIVKLNGKTNLIKASQRDPISRPFLSVKEIMELKANGANIKAIGYTLYLGSDFESQMLSDTSKLIFDAHQNGLPVVLWVYPRGKAIKNDKQPHLLAGAVGVANSLGADFVVINFPRRENESSMEELREISLASGNTGLLYTAGLNKGKEDLLKTLNKQVKEAGSRGIAIGRNIHQKPMSEAVSLAKDVYNTLENCS